MITTCAHLDKKNEKVSTSRPKNVSEDRKTEFDTLWVSQQEKDLEVILRDFKTSDKFKKDYLIRKIYLRIVYFEKIFQFKLVEKYLETLVEFTHNNFEWDTKLAVVYLRNGHFEKAQNLLEKVYIENSGEQKQNAGIVLASLYDTLGKNKKAIEIYKDITKSFPGQFDACLKLSQLKKKNYGTKLAVWTLEDCRKKSSKSNWSKFYIEMAKLYMEEKNLRVAENYLYKAIKFDKNDPLPLIMMSSIWESQGKSIKTIIEFEKFLKINPDDQRITSRIIDLYVENKNMSKIVYHLEKLSDLQNSNIQVRFKLALIYREQKRYNDSNKIFQEILLVDNVDSDRVNFYQYLNYKDLQDIEKAITALYKIKNESPLYLEASIHIANMLRRWHSVEIDKTKKNNIENKFFEFTQARKNKSDEHYFELSVNEILFLEDLNRIKQAIKICEGLLGHKLFKNDHLYFFANLLEKDQQFSRVDRLINGLVEKDPKNAHAWNFLGYSQLIRPNGNLDLAYNHIKKALKLSPHDHHIRDSLGWYFYKKNKYHLAVKELMFASKGLPEDKTVTEHLALALEKINDYFNAVVYYKKLKRKTKNPEKIQFIDNKINQLTELERRSPANNPRFKKN